ncbi:hypothetical protein B7494_g4038 [Chlorociboria aeruginascens]|nr:hypothetical protein B7494_g4038 [Chlorociboria aeruginascens]
MDAFDELERMARNAAEPESQASPSDIARWQHLFSYSYDQAKQLIEQQMDDYVRARVSDEHWDMVRHDWEARGYDRQAFEHELSIGRNSTVITGVSSKISASQARTHYLLKLEGSLNTAEKIRIAAGMQQLPRCRQGQGEEEAAAFCEVDGVQKQAITAWLASQTGTSNFKPTFVRITQARKEFSASWYPTLGIDSTLPQYRASAENSAPSSQLKTRIPSGISFTAP